jgi:hypothetical protein
MIKNKSKGSKSSKKTLFVVSTVVFLCLSVILGYRYYKHNQPQISHTPTPTITSLSRKVNTNNNKNVDSATNHSIAIGGPTNSNNAPVVSTAPNTWTQSESGVVIVKLPVNNNAFVSGDKLIGSASTTKVQYTLIDDNVGVISQGTIPVLNGNFSATINFSPSAKTGRLDVFTTENNGKEINEVQLKVAL